ncbi:hypothetical protein [Paenibacillus alvei]|uniref:Uncharacterized protein n=1 Tax=Paenibacillus alvei TaxID=44250 RepID=A0AAP7DJS3_PAEAL|nr:hypothetical protein [Paenibacillus alvei]NOJ72220.1 hypothetical protein [Paenibacillus alvei]
MNKINPFRKTRALDESSADQVLTSIVRNQPFLSEWEIRREESFYTIDEQSRLLSEERIHMGRPYSYGAVE